MKNKLYIKFKHSIYYIIIFFMIISISMIFTSYYINTSYTTSLLLSIILLLFPIISIIIINIFYPREIVFNRDSIIIYYIGNKKDIIEIKNSFIISKDGNLFLQFNNIDYKRKRINLNVFDNEIKNKIISTLRNEQ